MIEVMSTALGGLVGHKGRVGLFIVLTLLLACEAERDNPLDPNSPLYEGDGAIIGWVKTRVGNPISEVMLITEPEDKFCFSAEDGFYELKEVAPGSCKVTASKEGYATDSRWIEVAAGAVETANFSLDILPQFIDCRGHTHHISRNYPFEDLCYAAFEAEVFDGDGLVDIDSVWLWIAGLPDTFALEYDAGRYRKIVYADSLPDRSLETLIGSDCYFLVRDKADQETRSGPVRVARIIYETPAVVSPSNFEVVGKNPELVWRSLDLSYFYTYTVEVTKIQSGAPPVIIWSQEEIPKSDTTVTVPVDLAPCYYYWTVWVVDEFGDRSRSREAGFKVK